MSDQMQRQNISSGTPWESTIGYSRAVRVGNVIHLAGTTATDEHGQVIGPGDVYRQTVSALANIERALRLAGARLSDVVRTRLFVVDIDDWQRIAEAHGEVFREIRPAATIVEVRRLIDPMMLIEIEADAMIAE
jgi:enamine deaminase RidA (YjgF/YER057c/UK114 family)